MTIALKNVAKPSIASSPAEMVVSTPVNPTTAAPVTASVSSVMPNDAQSRRGSRTSTTRTSSAPPVSSSSGSR